MSMRMSRCRSDPDVQAHDPPCGSRESFQSSHQLIAPPGIRMPLEIEPCTDPSRRRVIVSERFCEWSGIAVDDRVGGVVLDDVRLELGISQ